MVAPTSKAFANDQDYISFDFGDEAASSSQTEDNAAAASTSSTPAASKTALRSSSSGGAPGSAANGKKRKLDERDDGLSKKDRVRQAARGTPWSIDVDWHRCWNAAEM